jgi:hypothetical protein
VLAGGGDLAVTQPAHAVRLADGGPQQPDPQPLGLLQGTEVLGQQQPRDLAAIAGVSQAEAVRAGDRPHQLVAARLMSGTSSGACNRQKMPAEPKQRRLSLDHAGRPHDQLPIRGVLPTLAELWEPARQALHPDELNDLQVVETEQVCNL